MKAFIRAIEFLVASDKRAAEKIAEFEKVGPALRGKRTKWCGDIELDFLKHFRVALKELVQAANRRSQEMSCKRREVQAMLKLVQKGSRSA
jgi:hypothetical protein